MVQSARTAVLAGVLAPVHQAKVVFMQQMLLLLKMGTGV